jgi:hypothetical protein
MKIIDNVTIYKCDFCKKELKRKHAMANHEQWCNSNPKNFKACTGCVHLEATTIEHDAYENDEYGSRTVTKKANAFMCNALNRLVYPSKVEKKKLPERYPETFKDQIPMPTNCSLFSYGDIDFLLSNEF